MLGGDFFTGFNVHCLGVAIEHGYAHRRWIDQNRIVTKDFPSFPNHFHLLLGIAVFLEYVNMGKHVEGNLLGVYLSFSRFSVEQIGRLFLQLLNGLFACAGNRLVSAYIDAHNANRVMDGFQCHQQLNGGTIRVGDDAMVLVKRYGLRVYLRHDKRYVVLVAELGGVVDDHATRCGRNGCPMGGH